MSSGPPSSTVSSSKQGGEREHLPNILSVNWKISALTLFSVNWKISALTLFMVMSIIWALGILAVTHPELIIKLFSLDNETNIPTVSSTLLLFGAAYICYTTPQEGRWRGINIGMAAFFCFMGMDELFAIHERLDKFLENTWPIYYRSFALLDWQTFYIPIALLGGIFWLYHLLRMRKDRTAVVMWIGGALFWLVAQLFEGIAWDWGAHRHVEGYFYYMITEEIFEMIGSSLFLLALLKRYRAHPAEWTPAS